jgi:proteasome lid subunit RPN8/RPN11
MLKIPPAEFAALRRHGEETYPHECCGVLLGRLSPDGETRTVERAVRCANQNTERGHDRYVIDPRDLVRIQREGRAAGLDIIGFYHSHPDHPARWSQTDLAEAHWLGCSYLITRVGQGGAQDSNSFVLQGAGEDDKHFAAETLETVETAAASEHRMSC